MRYQAVKEHFTAIVADLHESQDFEGARYTPFTYQDYVTMLDAWNAAEQPFQNVG